VARVEADERGGGKGLGDHAGHRTAGKSDCWSPLYGHKGASIGEALGGEVGANVQKIFAYGLRNSFGMAFDPVSGDLWEQESGRHGRSRSPSTG
jgi:hypothetical protein